MLVEVREKKIIEMLDQQGSVTISNLSNILGVSKVTIRRDIDKLAKEITPIQRVRGGAIFNRTETSYESFEEKSKRFAEVKRRIGNMAASLVNEGDTVILDSGSTNFYVGESLLSLKNITIITNDLEIALCVANSPRVKAIFAGGEIRPLIFSCYGPLTENYFNHLVVDKLFLGVESVDVKKGITNAQINEAKLKQKMISSAKEVIMIADSSKFDKSSLAVVCDFSKINIVVSDKKIPKKYINFFKQKGIKLYLV